MTHETIPQNIFERPAYHGMFPLAWRGVDAQTAPPADAANEDVLRACYLLDDKRIETEDDDERGQDLARIEQRLNVLIDLVGQVMAAQVAMPARVPCAMNAIGVQWREQRAPRVGETVELNIFPDPRYPRPLCLRARIEQVVPEGEHSLIAARFEPMLVAVSDALEKLIFRQQRRQIAQSKRKR
jgi:hypothetical protein